MSSEQTTHENQYVIPRDCRRRGGDRPWPYRAAALAQQRHRDQGSRSCRPIPWPRDVSISNAALLIYQPQVNSWVDNKLDFRSAMAIKPTGAKDETFGVVFATARTQVDKVERMVVFENLQDHEARFPDAAGSWRQLPRRAAEAFHFRRQDDLARPPAGIARRRRASSRRRCRSSNTPPQVHRQLLARDPRADRRRAGAEAGAEPLPRSARDQYARADSARRTRQ